jgi:hypothetical protein
MHDAADSFARQQNTTQGGIPMSSAITQPGSISGGVVIVVGLAFNEADGPAFDQAARIARRVPGSTLHLVHVFDRELSAARSRDLIDHLRLYVNEKAAVSDGLAGVTVGIHLRSGKVVREIIQLAQREVRTSNIGSSGPRPRS